MSGGAIKFEVSDGDPSHRPGPTSDRKPAKREEIVTYLTRVGELVSRSLDTDGSGLTYQLESLPDGYALYRYHRPGTNSKSNTKHVDKFLYGHPSSYIFNSTNDFKPHAIWLLEDQEGECKCNGCRKSAGQPKPQKVARKPGRPPKGSSRPAATASEQGSLRVLRVKPTAAEMAGKGEDNIWTTMFTTLMNENFLDTEITDTKNKALEIEQKVLFPQWETTDALNRSHRFRTGELVLFQPAESKSTEWRAGVVTELPHPVPPTIEESSPTVTLSNNYTGYRIEPMSDPNSHRKDEQTQWSYFLESRVRPFSQYPYLINEKEANHDKTISNARKCLATFSLAVPYRFRGFWPNAHILHKAIYLGAELLIVGDFVDTTVSLNQSSSSETENLVMKITNIAMKFTNLQPDPPSHTFCTGDHGDSIEVQLHGYFFTSHDESKDTKMNSDSSSTSSFDSPSHPSHLQPLDPNTAPRTYTLPLSQVLGRHLPPARLDADGVLPSIPQSANPVPIAVVEGRAWARVNDTRLVDFNRELDEKGMNRKLEWHWADNRVEALGLDRFGENDVGEGYERLLAKEKMPYDG